MHQGELDYGPLPPPRPRPEPAPALPPEVIALDDVGGAKHDDGPTAKWAAILVRAKATSARPKLLATYVEAPGGLMDEEACQKADLSLNSEYATRISELIKYGFLRETQNFRLGRAGVARRVCVITQLGRLVLRDRAAAIKPKPKETPCRAAAS